MEKKKRWPLIVVLWGMFLLTVACVAYLSFQSGEDAKAFGKEFIGELAKARYSQKVVTDSDMDAFTYLVRQNGRALAFFVIGILGTVTFHVTFYKCNWLLRTTITVTVLGAIAYLTEKLKLYIPTRHYSYEEMLISLRAVAAGFIMASAIILAAGALKGFFRRTSASQT